ncbi:ATP-binding cassette domain-containing protein [bacterium]|nr:ATP-binding cassette domain-containing protein [bacterium]
MPMTQSHQTSAILADRVSIRIGGVPILHEVSWDVPRGARVALLGPNGSGKTTLLRLITGYRFPTTGTMTVLGEELGQTNLDELRLRVGLLDPNIEHLAKERLRAIEVVLSGFFGHLCIDFDVPTESQIASAHAMLADVGLESHADQIFATLSTGEQRRVLLARALASDPELLILDEPTAGLDLLAREMLLATVDRVIRLRPEMTVLVVTHHLDELLPETSDILLLTNGRVAAQGSPSSVLTNEILTEVFQVPVTVNLTSGRWQWHVEPDIWPTLMQHSK